LIAKGTVAGEARGWVRLADGTFQSDRQTEAPLADAALRAFAGSAGQELTYTCVPPGAGTRAGIDRDEVDAGTDPADPQSAPLPVLIGTKSLSLKDDVLPPVDAANRRFVFIASTNGAAPNNRVILPGLGSTGDPTAGGGTIRIYNSAGLTSDDVTVDLPASGWTTIGNGKGYRFVGASADPIRRILVKGDKITVRGGQASFGYTLNEVRQGAVAVFLRLGTHLGWCASAPAKPTGAPSDYAGRFVGAPKSPAPATCPTGP
jgi:hypothetical protein